MQDGSNLSGDNSQAFKTENQRPSCYGSLDAEQIDAKSWMPGSATGDNQMHHTIRDQDITSFSPSAEKTVKDNRTDVSFVV